MSKPYTKCLKCNLVVETMSEFDAQEKRKEWYIGPTSDGFTWDWYHDCDLAKKNKDELNSGKKKWGICFGDTYAMDLYVYAKEVVKIDEYRFSVDGVEMTFDCQPIRFIGVAGGHE